VVLVSGTPTGQTRPDGGGGGGATKLVMFGGVNITVWTRARVSQ